MLVDPASSDVSTVIRITLCEEMTRWLYGNRKGKVASIPEVRYFTVQYSVVHSTVVFYHQAGREHRRGILLGGDRVGATIVLRVRRYIGCDSR